MNVNLNIGDKVLVSMSGDTFNGYIGTIIKVLRDNRYRVALKYVERLYHRANLKTLSEGKRL